MIVLHKGIIIKNNVHVWTKSVTRVQKETHKGHVNLKYVNRKGGLPWVKGDNVQYC